MGFFDFVSDSIKNNKDSVNEWCFNYGVKCAQESGFIRSAEEGLEFEDSLNFGPLQLYIRDHICSNVRESREHFLKGYNSALNEHHKRHNKSIEKHALSCRECNGLAIPIEGTERNYNCKKCGNRFSGARHPF